MRIPLIALLLLLAASAQADTIVTTLPLWNGSNSICCFAGAQGIGSFGENVTAPLNPSVLNTVTFEIANSEGTGIPFYFYVTSWNGSTAAGPVLFRSPLQVTGSAQAFASYTFTPDLPVVPGAQYLLFASNGETDYTAHPGNLEWGYLSADPYPGGAFRFLPKGYRCRLGTVCPGPTPQPMAAAPVTISPFPSPSPPYPNPLPGPFSCSPRSRSPCFENA